MRILYVLPYAPSLIRVRPYNLVRQLSRRHEVAVLAADVGRGSGDSQALRALAESVDVVPVGKATSLRSCVVAAARGEPLQGAVCRSPELELRLRRLLSTGRYDLVHVEHLRAAHVEAVIPEHVPTVFDSVDCISLLLERTSRSSHSLRQRILAAVELRRTRAYEAYLLSRFDQVAVTSPVDRAALLALWPGAEVTVVPNGVDLEYFRPLGGPREPATLVFSGKMSYHANVSAVLHFARRIFPLIRKERPEVRLRIVGSDPPRSVQALARDPAIAVTGYLPDIRQAVGQATAAICPVTVKVGTQNKVLEAMALGLPVVSSAAGAEGLEAEPGRDLLVAGSPTEFAAHVCRLLSDGALRGRLGRAGRLYVEGHHRWEDAARGLEALYVRAIERRSQRSLAGLESRQGL